MGSDSVHTSPSAAGQRLRCAACTPRHQLRCTVSSYHGLRYLQAMCRQRRRTLRPRDTQCRATLLPLADLAVETSAFLPAGLGALRLSCLMQIASLDRVRQTGIAWCCETAALLCAMPMQHARMKATGLLACRCSSHPCARHHWNKRVQRRAVDLCDSSNAQPIITERRLAHRSAWGWCQGVVLLP